MTEQTPDLFGFRSAQGDLFANEAPRNNGIGVADPVVVRARMHKLLAQAKAAQTVSPWNERNTAIWEDVFPNMANWLPKEEAEQLRLEFRAEMERLRPARKSA